ncbi:hypothetical protein OAS88_00895 [Planktomarina temperata]|nr:hypothetical protein [Planktomarina temperata]MDC1094161.1 hypothetical protein [Planktomarina temperata]
MKFFNSNETQIEIVSQADIPSGTGLGSSGSFTTALAKGLAAYYRKFMSQVEIAELACHIEIDKLCEPVGKQDQYAAAIGGINSFSFKKDTPVGIKSLDLDPKIRLELEERLLLFFTGFSRNAGSVLQDQDTKTKKHDSDMMNNLHFVKQLGIESERCLLVGDLIGFSSLMNEHWEYKKKRSEGMSNSKINLWYEEGLRNGALAGKLVGAGGGGFLMFLAEDKYSLRSKMSEYGLIEVPFRFDYSGTTVMSG